MKTLIQIIKEHIQWRHQIVKLAKADIIKTYSGAALGWAWAIIKPTITIMVLWFAFSVGLRQGGDIHGYPYILWLIAGYIPWVFMQEIIPGGAGSIRKYKFLVTKMKFPVATIPTFVNIAKITIHVGLMILVIALFLISGHAPTIYWLQLPIYMALMLLFFIPYSLCTAMLASMSKDFLNLIKSVTTPVFWMSGIMWDINRIGNPVVQKILEFNPVTFVATGYRNAMIYEQWIWEDWSALGAYAIVLVVFIILAIWSYKKLIREIPDVL